MAAVSSGQVAVTDAPIVALNTATPSAGVRLYIKNMTVEPVYLGAAAVLDTDGYELLEDEQVEVLLEPGQQLFAVSTVTGTTVSVLRS